MWSRASTVHQSPIIDDDLARGYLDAVVLKRWLTLPGEKLDHHSPGSYHAMGNGRKSFTAALQPEPAQVDLDEFGVEDAFCRREKLNVGGPYRRLVAMRIREAEGAARRHASARRARDNFGPAANALRCNSTIRGTAQLIR